MRWYVIWLLAFAAAFGVQAALWHAEHITDESVWTRRVEDMARDLKSRPLIFDASRYSGHPGMTVILGGGLLRLTGLSGLEALRFAMTILIAAAAAGIVTMCKVLRPERSWWVWAFVLATAHPNYLHASPTNAIAMVLLTLAVLLAWRGPKAAWLMGITLGLSAATRLPITVLIGAPLVLYIWRLSGWQSAATATATGLAALVATNPLLWQAPVEHMAHIFARSQVHYAQIVTISPSVQKFLFPTALAWVSLALGVCVAVFAWRRPRLDFSPPASLIATLVVTSAGVGAILLTAAGFSLRYFYPLILMWELLLPLFFLQLAAWAGWATRFPSLTLERSLLAVLILGNLAVFFSSMF